MRLALVVAATAMVAACAGGGVTFEGPDGGPTVFVVGDSLTAEASDEIVDLLQDGGDRVGGRWEHGKTTAWAVERLADQLQAERPDVAILAMGTNDWIEGWNAGDRGAITTALDLLGRVGCGIWVVPATVRWPEGERVASQVMERLVERVVSSAEERPDVHVARWDVEAAAHPEWYLPDGIHHTDAGTDAYAAFLASARHRHCPS